MNKIKKIDFWGITRPLRAAFVTALGKKNLIKSVMVEVLLSNGVRGKGEVPTSFVLRHENIPAIKNILRSITPGFSGVPIDLYQEQITKLRKELQDFPMTISGLEVALFRAYLNAKGVTEHKYWGGKLSKLETDITIPFILDEGLLKKWLSYTIRRKFRIYKLKVSGELAKDKKILSFVFSYLMNNVEDFEIRLDGNQGYSASGFMRMLDFIKKNNYKIQLFEQPLRKDDYKGLKYIRIHSYLPVILDETVFNSQDAQYLVNEHLAHGINIKIAKSGIMESAKILDIAKRYRLKTMIGCMTETMVGLSAGIYFAAGTGKFDFIDLDSVYFLHYRDCFENIRIEDAGFRLNCLKL